MTDGAEFLLRLRKLIPVPTRLVLDYFHVAMKVRHADQCIGKITPYAFSPNGPVFELYDRFNYLRGYLWSGRRDKFKKSFDRLLYLLDRVQSELSQSMQAASMASGHLCDLEWYLRKNAKDIINYQEWRRARRRISTSAVEGTVNRLIRRRVCKPSKCARLSEERICCCRCAAPY